MNKMLLILGIITGGILLSCNPTKRSTTTGQSGSSVNDKLSKTDLEKFLTLGHGYLKIPVTKMPSGHLHINAVVNGIGGEFILDTGAGATVIDTKRKGKFNLKTEKTDESGAGAGGTATLEKSIENSFKIGSLELLRFTIYSMNLDHVNAALVSMGIKEVDGVIGADILTANQGIIDYSKLVLYLKK